MLTLLLALTVRVPGRTVTDTLPVVDWDTLTVLVLLLLELRVPVTLTELVLEEVTEPVVVRLTLWDGLGLELMLWEALPVRGAESVMQALALLEVRPEPLKLPVALGEPLTVTVPVMGAVRL